MNRPESQANPKETRAVQSSNPGEGDTAGGETRALPDTVGSEFPTKPQTQEPTIGETAPPSGTQAEPSSDSGGEQKLTNLGEFKLISKLGAGGMGAVYKAHQPSLDREVALKVLAKHLAANTGFVKRFYREARTLARLDHPNIVRGYAVGEQDGWHYFAMEFIDGASIQDWMNRREKLSIADGLHVVLACAEALRHAHEQSIIHRDIKPDNVLVTSNGVVKLADMGLAKALTEDMSLTESGTGFGTPYYMAPEQARNAKYADHRSDIYSLGCTLYYVITGVLPFEGETVVEITAAKERDQHRPARRLNSEVPERLDLIIDKMLSKEPQHRYQSYDELIKDLQSLNLAGATLQFLGKPTQQKRTAAATAGELAATRQTASRGASTAGAEQWWYVRTQTPEGKAKVHKVTRQKLIGLIKNERFDVATKVSRTPKGDFLPIGSYPELERVLRARLVQKEVERKAAPFVGAYANIERYERRRRFWKRISNVLGAAGSGLGFLLWLGILVVVGGLGYWFYTFVMDWMASQTGG